jgi:hypothetical protein
MYEDALMLFFSVLLFVYGSVSLASPEYARQFHLRQFHTEKPNNWYERLSYLKPPPLWVYRVAGLLFIGLSLVLFAFVYSDLVHR